MPKSATPLFSAIARDNLIKVEQILNDINNSNQINQVVNLEAQNLKEDSKIGSGDWTPLLWACRNNLTDIAISLIEKGADIHRLRETSRNSCLYFACLKNSMKLATLLIEKGANVNQKNSNGETPLYIASEAGNVEVLEMLIKNGAIVNEKVNEGYFPLFVASTNGHVEVVKVLIQNGANLNEKDNFDVTSLYIASQAGHIKVVRELLLHKAIVDVKSKDGTTALMIASGMGHLGIVIDLITAGARINEQSADGRTALYCACASTSKTETDKAIEVIRVLVASGADPSIRTTNGQLAINATINKTIQDGLSKAVKDQSIGVLSVSKRNTLEIKCHFK